MKFELPLVSHIRMISIIMGSLGVVWVIAGYLQSIILSLISIAVILGLLIKFWGRLVTYSRTVILRPDGIYIVETYREISYYDLKWFRIESSTFASNIVLGVRREKNLRFGFVKNAQEFTFFRNALFKEIHEKNSGIKNFNKLPVMKALGVIVVLVLLAFPVIVIHYEAWEAIIAYGIFSGTAFPFLSDVFFADKPIEYFITKENDV